MPEKTHDASPSAVSIEQMSWEGHVYTCHRASQSFPAVETGARNLYQSGQRAAGASVFSQSFGEKSAQTVRVKPVLQRISDGNAHCYVT
jgi:hypothetical protein